MFLNFVFVYVISYYLSGQKKKDYYLKKNHISDSCLCMLKYYNNKLDSYQLSDKAVQVDRATSLSETFRKSLDA